jgi:hypothetical protein
LTDTTEAEIAKVLAHLHIVADELLKGFDVQLGFIAINNNDESVRYSVYNCDKPMRLISITFCEMLSRLIEGESEAVNIAKRYIDAVKAIYDIQQQEKQK